MLSKYFTLLVECCLAALVSSSIVKRSYQDFPLQMCPQDAVCSEIDSLSSRGLGPAAYMMVFKCKCPTGSECPAVPGSQTINTDTDKWYGFCQPVEDIPRCQRGDVAQQLIVESPKFNGLSYTKVHCLCPSHVLTQARADSIWSGATTDSAGTKYIDLRCGDNVISKRERYGGRNRSRGRFYFYKK